MVYSSGCLMYELWTHGCQPFTSYDQTMDTDDILRMVTHIKDWPGKMLTVLNVLESGDIRLQEFRHDRCTDNTKHRQCVNMMGVLPERFTEETACKGEGWGTGMNSICRKCVCVLSLIHI